MVVQHNMQAMNANRMLGITAGQQAKSTEKLSSGYKINRAADNAAGLAISEKMRKQIRDLDQTSSNAQDGISAVQTAEGALNEVQDMLQRMNELAVQAANGTNSVSDRQSIQDEIDQLTTEIDRVSETTKFNETYLLRGDNTAPKKFSFNYGQIAEGTGKGATVVFGSDPDDAESGADPATGLQLSVVFAGSDDSEVEEIADAADQNAFTLRGADFDPALYQYKPLYGTSWNNMSELPIDTLSIAGTTLMIRKAFVETAGSENVASAEAKVKIAAAPKAPKATVDYKKGVVTIPNKTEYKVIYASGENDSATRETSATMTETAAWKPVSTKASLSPKNILKESGITDPETQDKLLESGFIVAIRTAYDGQKKKAASSINFVTIGETAKSETIEGEDGIKVGEATFKWAFGDNDKVTFTATNGDFEYADSEDSTRWTKVSGSKTVSVTSGTTIYVRRMGDKASSLLPSDITPVKFEKAEKPAAVASVTVSVKNGESTTVTKPTDATNITVEFVATVTDTDGAELTGQTITWKLDDTSSADAGVTLDKTTGSITITKDVTVKEVTVTATAGEKSGSCKITIATNP